MFLICVTTVIKCEFIKGEDLFMNKSKKLLKITICALLIAFSVGSISVIASSDNYAKDKVNKLTEKFNTKKSNLEKTGTYDTTSEDAKEIKKLGIEIADLSEQIRTEEDYRKKLESLMRGARLGLEDTKEEQKLNYHQSTQDFIDKMGKKLDDIEAEMKENDELAKNSPEIKKHNSNNSPSKKLIERLKDHSDVD